MKRLLLSLLALIVPVAFADDVLKLGTVYDLPVMYLSSPITSTTQVEPEITIAAPIRNGSALIIPSLSGAVFEIAFGGYTESVYASRVAVNATTGVITLTGSVVRDLCYNQATAFTSCNNGRRWGKGAQVRLVDTAKRFNRLADRTLSNVFNASGAIKFSGSGTIELPSYTSDTQRTQQSPTPNLYSISCLDSTGKCSIYAGGQWTEIATATGSFVNASETVAGKVELATVSDMTGSVLVGSTTAPLVLQSRYATSTGSLAINKGWVGLLGRSGRFTGSLLVGNATTYSKSGSVVLNPATLSGTYAVAASQQYVPLAPIGSIMLWPTDTAPAGWLLADGKCHTRTGTGAALFAVIGTTFQASCASNTFGVPDMRGRFALGQDDMGGTSANRVTDTRADTIGSGSGSSTHTQSKAELAPHTHVISGARYQSTTNGAGGQILESGGSGVATTSTGSGTPMDIMNPYITLNYIIRAR